MLFSWWVATLYGRVTNTECISAENLQDSASCSQAILMSLRLGLSYNVLTIYVLVRDLCADKQSYDKQRQLNRSMDQV
jgi:hypothetical protein